MLWLFALPLGVPATLLLMSALYDQAQDRNERLQVEQRERKAALAVRKWTTKEERWKSAPDVFQGLAHVFPDQRDGERRRRIDEWLMQKEIEKRVSVRLREVYEAGKARGEAEGKQE